MTPETIAQLERIGRTPDSEKPAGTYARHILDRLRVDLSWASSQLEGNAYSLLDTKRLIAHGQTAEGNYACFRLRPSEYQAWRESLQRA